MPGLWVFQFPEQFSTQYLNNIFLSENEILISFSKAQNMLKAHDIHYNELSIAAWKIHKQFSETNSIFWIQDKIRKTNRLKPSRALRCPQKHYILGNWWQKLL